VIRWFVRHPRYPSATRTILNQTASVMEV